MEAVTNIFDDCEPTDALYENFSLSISAADKNRINQLKQIIRDKQTQSGNRGLLKKVNDRYRQAILSVTSELEELVSGV